MLSPRLILALAVALLAAWWGHGMALPPAPLPANAPPTAFSATRAMADVRAIGMRPHPLGTADSSRVADYLVRRLQALGMIAEERSYLVDDSTALHIARWSGGLVIPNELTDVVGVVPGRDRTKPALLLMAHYDTVWGSPGAADDSAGVASILEIVRAIRARGRPARDVIALFTDGEETGLSGAKAFWAGGGLAARVGLVINLESRGAGGRAIMFETGARNGDLMKVFGASVPHPVANSLATFAYKKMPNNTDFSVPRDRGLPGLNFAFLGRAAYYHSPLLTIDRLDPATVQDMGGQALGIASALAFAPALPGRSADATFFDIGGGRFVRYTPGTGWLVVLAAAGLVGFAWWRARPARRAIATGVVTGLWVMAHAVLVLTWLNQLSGAGKASNYYDRLAALPRLETQAWLALLAVGVAGFALRRMRPRWIAVLPALILAILARTTGAPGLMVWPAAIVGMLAGLFAPANEETGIERWIGLVALSVALSALVQIAAAPAAWVLAWPTLVVALALAVSSLAPGLAPIVAAIAVLVMAPPLIAFAHFLMLGLGAPTPQVLMVAIPSLFAALWPLARMRWGQGVSIAVAVLLVAGVALALQVRTDPMAQTVPAYSLVDPT